MTIDSLIRDARDYMRELNNLLEHKLNRSDLHLLNRSLLQCQDIASAQSLLELWNENIEKHSSSENSDNHTISVFVQSTVDREKYQTMIEYVRDHILPKHESFDDSKQIIGLMTRLVR